MSFWHVSRNWGRFWDVYEIPAAPLCIFPVKRINPRRKEGMKNVRVSKDKLMETVQKNRDNHRQVFEEALEGYVTFTKEKLDELAERLSENGRIPEYISIPFPEDHTSDYDRVLGMLQMTLDTEVELTPQEYAQYVQDDWGWQKQFTVSNAMYSTTAQATAERAGWV